MEYTAIPEEYFRYDLKKHDFDSVIMSVFEGADSFEQLHEIVPSAHQLKDLVGVSDDNRTWLHDKFYLKLNSGWPEFVDLYEKFIHEDVKRFISESNFLKNHCDEYAYQRYPTFRVQIPGNYSVGEFHRDSDYNHPIGEINFVVPLTNATDTGSIWCESSPGKKDFHPLNMKKGNVIMFDGNMCDHGNHISEMNTCRVSFDFRLLPMKYHNKSNSQASVDLDKKFIIGDYYADRILEI